MWAALTVQVCPCHWFVLHWTSSSSSTVSPQEGTAGLPSRPESPTNKHTYYTPEDYNKHTSDILSAHTHTHLAVLSVDQLICEYVLRKESVRQRFTLILDHRELGQSSRRIWDTQHTFKQLMSYPVEYDYMSKRESCSYISILQKTHCLTQKLLILVNLGADVG